jgi:hypothetical protein
LSNNLKTKKEGSNKSRRKKSNKSKNNINTSISGELHQLRRVVGGAADGGTPAARVAVDADDLRVRGYGLGVRVLPCRT